jgi:hypothetical protein
LWKPAVGTQFIERPWRPSGYRSPPTILFPQKSKYVLVFVEEILGEYKIAVKQGAGA